MAIEWIPMKHKTISSNPLSTLTTCDADCQRCSSIDSFDASEPVKLNKHTISINAIMLYRHEGLIEKIEDKLDLQTPEAHELFATVKRFLYLCATTKESLSPSKAIDDGWHLFILHTADYAAFCTRYLGRFIHHQPFTRAQKMLRHGNNEGRLKQLAIEAFGKKLSQNWGFDQIEASNCHGCEDCAPIQPNGN